MPKKLCITALEAFHALFFFGCVWNHMKNVTTNQLFDLSNKCAVFYFCFSDLRTFLFLVLETLSIFIHFS
jgi:hypothetical protein